MSYMTNREFESKMKKIKTRNKQIQMKNKLKEEKRKVSIFKLPNISTSNKMLITSIISIVLFTIACLFIQYKTSVEVSSTLITLWYSFWTVEILSLAGIKITKVIRDCQLNSNGSNIDSELSDENNSIIG